MRLPLTLLLSLCCAGVVHGRDYPATPSGYLTMIDADRDGRISEAEYVDYLSAGFRRMDRNGDDMLDTGELPPGPRHTPRSLAAFQADLAAQFHRLDRNGDGSLSAKELAQPPR
jgi:Ca2+-binding EF-hand superfamily protein